MKIGLDPGHGYSNIRKGVYDPGCSYEDLEEASIVLALCLTIAWCAKQKGMEVYLTRTDDSSPSPLSERDEHTEAEHCDCLVSFHCNESSTASARGLEIFYRDEKDKRLATALYQPLLNLLGTTSRGLKSEIESFHKRLAIFNANMPTCLVELGFISNAMDRATLQSILTKRNFRIDIAETVLESIEKWTRL